MLPAGASQRLCEVFRREDLEDAGNPGRSPDLRDAASHLCRDQVEVRGLSADHGSEADQSVEPARLGQAARDERDLESAGHPRERHVLGDHAVMRQAAAGALHESRGHELVEPRGHDRDPSPRPERLAAEDVHPRSPGTSSRWPSFWAFVRRYPMLWEVGSISSGIRSAMDRP